METLFKEEYNRFGFCNHSLVPLRTEPSHHAEMCTEILFGELYIVLESHEEWLRIRTTFDNYEGWINRSSYYEIGENEFRRLHSLPCSISTEVVQLIENRSLQIWYPILIGSSLHGLDRQSFSAGEYEYYFEGSTESIPQAGKRDKVMEMSMMYLHAPYRWGGRSPFGIDCSGLTQMSYKLAGVQLLRDASQQSSQGETINFITDARPGDLLFFDDEKGTITHTGILLHEGRIIHASGRVRVDSVDHEGIFNTDTRQYTHKLRLIKKIL